MNYLMRCSLIFSLFVTLSAEESLQHRMKKESKEDREFAKSQSSSLLKDPQRWDAIKNDILPYQDRGKEFKAPDLKKLESLNVRDNELHTFISSSKKREKFEGSEPEFTTLREDNEKVLVQDIDDDSELPTPTKKDSTIKCTESGIYQHTIVQTRVVEVSPGEERTVRKCAGHEHLKGPLYKEEEIFRYVQKQEQELSKDETLFSYSVEEKRGWGWTDVRSYWTHTDGIECDSIKEERHILSKSVETDHWEVDSPQLLKHMEDNPHCKLLYSTVLEGPNTRAIQNQPIYRDLWKQQLIFSCELGDESPCTHLYKKGGILIDKKCLHYNPFGDCDQWEKTYEMGGLLSKSTSKRTPEEQEIWGLNGEFNQPYESNTEIANVLTTLSVFAETKKDIENSDTDFKNKKAEIFKGEALECARSFLGGELFDCCKKMNGLAVKVHLAKCNVKEQSLAQQRSEGRCHHIGKKTSNLGLKTSQVFCCFSSKLARLVQEEGRRQLGKGWGDKDKPNCSGFTVDELTRIDFSKIDLTEVTEDLMVDQDKLMEKIRSTINQLQSQSDGQYQTQEIVKKQEQQASYGK